jgi:hypothetical protein
MMSLGVHYKFLSKKEFFRFPLKYFFKAYGSIPVDESRKYIDQIVELFHDSQELHILISPEGQLAKNQSLEKRFLYMATKAKVPIVVGYMDYTKKELALKELLKLSKALMILC